MVFRGKGGQTFFSLGAPNLQIRPCELRRKMFLYYNLFIFLPPRKQVPIPLDPLQSVAIGAVETSLKLNAAAIVVTTTTGRSAALLSMYRPRCPIVAVTRYGVVARWLLLYHSIHPLHYRRKQ